ncbi:hypothetical protein AB0I37_11975 [Micromonospora purpureochromogenes]|uniref:hypothetical protein n=1 Tax=Micromonospora purpureochromogenes TaxID=47872 RepID=UPI0033FE6F14
MEVEEVRWAYRGRVARVAVTDRDALRRAGAGIRRAGLVGGSVRRGLAHAPRTGPGARRPPGAPVTGHSLAPTG